MRTIKTEFPDFDDELPNLWPLTDNSWHNDAMPQFRAEALPGDKDARRFSVVLWVDYKNPELREFKYPYPRFMVQVFRDDCDYFDLVDANTWDELRYKLNDWYLKNVGRRPDDDEGIVVTGKILPIGRLIFDVGMMAYFHKWGLDSDE